MQCILRRGKNGSILCEFPNFWALAQMTLKKKRKWNEWNLKSDCIWIAIYSPLPYDEPPPYDEPLP